LSGANDPAREMLDVMLFPVGARQRQNPALPKLGAGEALISLGWSSCLRGPRVSRGRMYVDC
jgi:hypothetical protein